MGQMMINIGMVLGLLPVIGIPLPLVSYGGSALLPTLVALGLLSAFARAEPGPRAALRRRGEAPAALPAGLGAATGRGRRRVLMRVLLAGGGTAGHTSPLLATADALRRLDPAVEITCLGTARGPGDPGGPGGRLPARADPAGAAAAPAQRRPAPACPAGCARAVKAALEVARPGPARRRGRLRRLRLGARLPRRPPAQAAARRPRGQRPARHRQQARRPVHRRTSRPASPTPTLPHATLHRAADPPDDLHARPGRAARRGPRELRPRPRPPDAAGHRRLAGRAPASTRPSPAPRRRSRRPASRCCTSSARRARPTAPRRPATAVRRGAVRRPDGPRLRRRRRSSSAAPARNTVTEVAGVGLPAIFVPLPIGNGEQALNARPVVDAGGGLLVADAALTAGVGAPPRVPGLLTDRDRLAAMSAAAAGADPARRRREAGRA